MKNLLLYLLIIFSASAFQGNKPTIVKWVTTSGCSLKVDGSTNINNFSCGITNYNRPDTITVTRASSQPVYLNGNVKLDVPNFDCHNPIMTADLRKTLKVKDFPQLMIFFISMSKYPEPGNKQDLTTGMVLIVLAGVSKRVEVDYKIISADNNFINLIGSRKVNFSDFNLTPPRKLGGMIQTNNELSVEFNLRMKVLAS
jgi:hypothetical protein